MVIYTKRGDRGETSLFDKDSSQRARVSKSSLIVEALGAGDELNSYLGVCKKYCENPERLELIEKIQTSLLTIGTIIAGSNLRFSASRTKELESIIDELEGNLPVLKNFVIPGGNVFASHLHYARALSRRTERRVVALSAEKKISEHILTYLNRLSDVLFMLSREANHLSRQGDRVWVGKKRG